jgi:hypothetical protein
MFPVVVDRRTGIPVSCTVSVIETAGNTVIKTSSRTASDRPGAESSRRSL